MSHPIQIDLNAAAEKPFRVVMTEIIGLVLENGAVEFAVSNKSTGETAVLCLSVQSLPAPGTTTHH